MEANATMSDEPEEAEEQEANGPEAEPEPEEERGPPAPPSWVTAGGSRSRTSCR